MINGVNHIALSTGDLERMCRFYEAVGFKRVWDSGWANDARVDSIIGVKGSAAKQAMLRAGNLYLEFFEYSAPLSTRSDAPMQPNDRGYTHLCLDVTDIDAEYARLVGLGMTFNRTPPEASPRGIRAVYGRDPDGNIVELQEILTDQAPFSLRALRGT